MLNYKKLGCQFTGKYLLALSGVLIFLLGLFACSGKLLKGSVLSLDDFHNYKSVFSLTSNYFDEAMGYQGSNFKAVSLREIVSEAPMMVDGILLECFDDYQGFISIDDIVKYDLWLAIEVQIASEFDKPNWLNPMLVIVPDNTDAPKREGFMTANIRELHFVNSRDYYSPLTDGMNLSRKETEGYEVFRKNCMFCHSLKGIGGNKGIDLPSAYNFSHQSGKERFVSDFLGFHHKDNEDKQNMEQFVNRKKLNEIASFLSAVVQN